MVVQKHQWFKSTNLVVVFNHSAGGRKGENVDSKGLTVWQADCKLVCRMSNMRLDTDKRATTSRKAVRPLGTRQGAATSQSTPNAQETASLESLPPGVRQWLNGLPAAEGLKAMRQILDILREREICQK